MKISLSLFSDTIQLCLKILKRTPNIKCGLPASCVNGSEVRTKIMPSGFNLSKLRLIVCEPVDLFCQHLYQLRTYVDCLLAPVNDYLMDRWGENPICCQRRHYIFSKLSREIFSKTLFIADAIMRNCSYCFLIRRKYIPECRISGTCGYVHYVCPVTYIRWCGI
ncbi:hypothetical protein DJ71_26820 [Halorubrum sp. E3]|nr:hypothetical protein DJ71_26820 [Halorubrum sp. E3]